MSLPTEEEMCVARAIRQAFETEANPGNAVSGPVPHMLQSQGTFNLHRVATIVLWALRAHRDAKQAAVDKAAEIQAKAYEAEVAARPKPIAEDLA